MRLLRTGGKPWRISARLFYVFSVLLWSLSSVLVLVTFLNDGTVPITGILEVALEKINGPLDDYYSRSHFDRMPVPLIVGGSDGSGTRAFVDTLKQLGVPFIVDDKVTFDLHAANLYKRGGWPALVNKVLEVTHSGNYDWEDLPLESRKSITTEMNKFKKLLLMRFEKQMKKEKEKRGNKNTTAELVTFAFKAPVAMLTLPIMTRFFGPIKFLHVVRDGRDVALSRNKSPVFKFYNTTYVDHQNRSEIWKDELEDVKGIQLWNDWNVQVNDWTKRNSVSSADKNMTVDYLVMRSEDLVDPSTKFEALLQLAHFVGAKLSPHELCCQSKREVMDHGSSYNISSMKHLNQRGKVHRKQAPAGKRGQVHRKQAPGAVTKKTAAVAKETHLAKEFLQLFTKWNSTLANAASWDNATLHDHIKQANVLFVKYKACKKQLNGTATLERIVGERSKLLHLAQRYGRSRRLDEADQVEQRYGRNRRLEEANQVKQRYGKWAHALKDKPELHRYFHQEGAAGLGTFGYKPQKTWMDRNHARLSSFQCDESVICT